jgi:hypothetical protein
MKLGITGHSRGLGECLFQRFHGAAIGFSRSNGYDISDPAARARIVKEVEDCDVFVNNAYAGFAQVDLLYQLYESWRDQPRLIINISSNSPDGIKSHMHPYASHKAALDKASEQLSYQKTALKVCNVRPGWIDTARADSHQGSKIDPQRLCDVIELIIRGIDSMDVIGITVLPR